jgi:superfamily I DNA/RNA helicase
VVIDEAQDLTEVGIRLLAAIAGGGTRPAITIVGDGQQSLYPGGFSLRSVGIDVRGRAFALKVNWRNTFAIWQAAQAFIAGDAFDDLEDVDAVLRSPDDTPMPVRDGVPPRLHVIEGGSDQELGWLSLLVADDIEAGADPGDCAVLAPSRDLARRAAAALNAAGIRSAQMQRYRGQHGDAVWIGTFFRAKGLEFKRVYIVGLNTGAWPRARSGHR